MGEACGYDGSGGGGGGDGAVLDIMLLLLNVGLEVFLVGQNVPVPLGDGLLLTHPDLLSHLDSDTKQLEKNITTSCQDLRKAEQKCINFWFN